MNGRLHRKASKKSHPMMVQTLLPEPFDEGPEEDRLIRLNRWAQVMYPGRVFTAPELSRLTGIKEQTIRDWQTEAINKVRDRIREAQAIENIFIS